MERIEHPASRAGRARLAGWLLITGGAAIFAWPQVRISAVALEVGPHYLSLLVLTVPGALILGLAPALVGFGLLKARVGARWIGTMLTVLGTFGLGAVLVWVLRAEINQSSTSTDWWFLALDVLLLVISVIVLWALATAGDFGDRSGAVDPPAGKGL